MGRDVAGGPEETEEGMKKHNSHGKKCKAISRAAANKQPHTGKNKGTRGKRFERCHGDDDTEVFWAKERKRQRMEVKLEDNKLFITLPRIVPPALSRSGKSYLIATTGGVKRTPLLVDGAPVHVVATVFIYEDWAPPVKFVPLIEIPKTEEEKEEEEEECDWATIPLLE
jgi:hypothetical protein